MTVSKAPPGALVTGAAQRIGRAIAQGLADDGWHVVIHYHRSADAANETAAAIEAAGGKATAIAADLSDPAAAARLVAAAAQATGELGCLVNNASMFAADDIATVGADSFDAMMAVNLRAPVLLSQAFAEALPDGAEGVIVNLLDQKLVNPNPDFLSYTLSKYGLSGLTTTLAMALGPRIRVCGVAPGLVLPSADQTPAQFASVHGRTPLGRGATAVDIAGAVRYLVSAVAVTGEVMLVDGGQHLVGSARDVMFIDANDSGGDSGESGNGA
ncbi:MAG: SDR family oxidoreductase [Alphaproteobacteria bacterium]|nr:SDR family oxidoreductase [Alphaproteobacteria bacterium]